MRRQSLACFPRLPTTLHTTADSTASSEATLGEGAEAGAEQIKTGHKTMLE